MDQNANSQILDLLAGRLLLIQEEMREGFKILQDKINPPEPQRYINDEILQQDYFITRAVRDKLVAKGILNPIKLNGSRSTSLYIREDVEQALKENGRSFPKSSTNG